MPTAIDRVDSLPPAASPSGQWNDPSGRRSIALSVLLGIATLIAYLPSLGGRLLWDDDAHVTRPSLQSLDGLRRIWCEIGATQQYYPVLHSAFWVEHRLWGDHVVGYHLVNILLHALAAGLVVAILRRLAVPGAWLAGFVFALHPVAVESVAWISEQKNTLSAVFYLAAALGYLRFLDSHRRPAYWAATALFVSALLTKSVTATLPAALLVLLWWKRGRGEWRRDWLPLLPWLAIAIPIGLFTSWMERHFIGADGTSFALSFGERLLLAGNVVWFYVGKLLWPADLMFIYPRWTIVAGAWPWYLGPIAFVAALAAAAFLARKHRGPLAALLFFAGTLFPVLGFFNVYPFLFSYVADHFQYLARLGLIVPFCAAVSLAANRIAPNLSWPRMIAAIGLLIPLAALTWRDASTYHDAATLYRTTLARNPSCWLAHYNLGVLEENQPGQMPSAMAHYRAAIQLNPSHWGAHNNLGSALLKQPDALCAATAEFETAIRLRPDFAEAHNNLGIAFSRAPGRTSDAIAQFTIALHLRPNYVEARLNLANLLAALPDRLPDALRAYEAALSLDPNDAGAHFNFANALLRQPDRIDEAIAEYRVALRLRPDFRQAHNNLASALARTASGLSLAIDEYRRALQLDPADAETHGNLANALLRTPGHLAEAIAEYEAGVKLAPRDAALHCSLGIALSDIRERWPDARHELETAVALRPDFAEAHYCLAVVLLRIGGPPEAAVTHLETTLRLKPGFQPAQTLLSRLRR